MHDYDALERRLQEIRRLTDRLVVVEKEYHLVEAQLSELLGIGPEVAAAAAHSAPATRLPRGIRVGQEICRILAEKGPPHIADIRRELNARYNSNVTYESVAMSIHYLTTVRGKLKK